MNHTGKREVAAVVRQTIASPSNLAREYAAGYLACATSAGWLTLGEKEAAMMAIVGLEPPAHLDRWWITIVR